MKLIVTNERDINPFGADGFSAEGADSRSVSSDHSEFRMGCDAILTAGFQRLCGDRRWLRGGPSAEFPLPCMVVSVNGFSSFLTCLVAAGVLVATAVSSEAQTMDLDRLQATRNRPLFVPSRRRAPDPAPAPQVAAAPVTVTTPPPNLQLSGVIVGIDRTVALVRRSSDQKLVNLEVGREIDGWIVSTIRPREVDLRLGTRNLTLRLSPR